MNKRLAYIGQDLFLSGQTMGERIVKLVGSGKVAIFIATPGQLNLQPRVDGAMDSIKKSGADIQATMIATDPAASAGLSKIQAYYLGNQDVEGMFGVSGGDTMNCGIISRQYDLPAKGVHAGGYDLLPKSLEAVRDGFLDFAIDQQPYLQGFYTVMEMFVGRYRAAWLDRPTSTPASNSSRRTRSGCTSMPRPATKAVPRKRRSCRIPAGLGR